MLPWLAGSNETDRELGFPQPVHTLPETTQDSGLTTHDTRLRVGVDIGGTFTDLILVDDETGAFTVAKSLTTPDDPSRASRPVLATRSRRGTASMAGGVDQIIHGTTLVTNALIERKGARDRAAGHRRVSATRSRSAASTATTSTTSTSSCPHPLVPRHLRFDVPRAHARRRHDACRPLDERVRRAARRELRRQPASRRWRSPSCTAYTNPADERRPRAAVLRAAPELRVSLSSEVVPEIREYERTSTTVANVYVQAAWWNVPARPGAAAGARSGFAGSLFADALQRRHRDASRPRRGFPIRLLESGPAAGALAAAHYGARRASTDLLSFDMGGTTAKFCVIETASR